VLEWLSVAAIEAFEAASEDLGRPIIIGEALRDVSLRHFYDSTEDNIGCRPPAGAAQLITGRAVRLEDDGAEGALDAAGFASSGDRWRFEGAGAADLDQLSTLAFQQPWNLNRPDDPIGDDGLIGPQTRAAIDRAPIAGFESELCGAEPEPDAGPDPEPDVGPDPEPDVGPDPEPDMGREPDPEPGMGPEPDPEPDVGPESEPDVGAEPAPDPEPAPTGRDASIPPPPVPGWSGLDAGDAGCGQSPSGSPSGAGWLLVALGLGVRRRRR